MQGLWTVRDGDLKRTPCSVEEWYNTPQTETGRVQVQSPEQKKEQSPLAYGNRKTVSLNVLEALPMSLYS